MTQLGGWADELPPVSKANFITWAKLGSVQAPGSLFGAISFLIEVANQQEAQIKSLRTAVERLNKSVEKESACDEKRVQS